MRYALALMTLLAGCNGRDLITLRYTLDQIDPADVIRVETVISIAPGDAREFFADQPYRSVATGVGYEVRDVDGSGKREVLITHDATLGFQFTPTFVFTLLPPASEAAPPLNIIARAMGASSMIGETMTIDAKFGPHSAAEVKIGNQRCGGAACLTSEQCCTETCAKVDKDAQNCGGCGMFCALNETCSGALCRCAGGSACVTGQSCCATMGCFDFQNDPFNCGSCGKACQPGETCGGGSCGCPGQGGAACAVSQVCCTAGCAAAATGCPCGATICTALAPVCCNNATCADLTNDNSNCGSCGHTCSAPLSCTSGSCRCHGVACSAGDACCSSGCANTQTDPANCGSCGHICNAGETCMGGQCVCGASACAAGQICCPGGATGGVACVDPNGDTRNCGFCGNRCGTGEQCTNSMCSCAGGPHCVGNQTCCGTGCADLANDPAHCGSCTVACTAGQACMGGNCVNTGCNPPCTDGNTCMGNVCTCNGGGACNGGKTCCPQLGCIDLQNDRNNCGSCGKPCFGTDLCCLGVCTPQGQLNCGSCSNKCTGSLSCCIDCHTGAGTCMQFCPLSAAPPPDGGTGICGGGTGPPAKAVRPGAAAGANN